MARLGSLIATRDAQVLLNGQRGPPPTDSGRHASCNVSYCDMSVGSSKHDLAAVEYAALAAFRYALHRYLRFSERAAQQAGLEPRQYQSLLLLRGLGHNAAATISDLAEWLQVRHHTAVELVDRMSARGLVERHAYPSDGRRVLVRLSAIGREALADLAVLHRDQLRQLAPTLVDTLQDLLVDQGVNQHSHSRPEGVSN